MMDDPSVAAVRQVRDVYAARFNYDIDAMFRELNERERLSGRSYVQYSPIPLPVTPPIPANRPSSSEAQPAP